ncbi:MAG: sporulation protein YunB [Oscillospiraceae bacterium]
MWRRPIFRRRSRGPENGLLLSLFLGVGLAFALIITLNIRLRPVMEALSTAEANHMVSETVNRAVSETARSRGISYSDMVTLEKDDTGKITALTGNTGQISNLQTTISDAVLAALDGIQVNDLEIPMGNLTGLEFFSGHGPSLRVRLVSVGAVNTRFRNEFTAAGINQTLHRILLEVTVKVSILLPGETLETEIVTPVCMAETVIVGNVPQQYFSIGEGGKTP